MSNENLWTTRDESIAYMHRSHPSRLDVMNRSFDLLDQIVDAFEAVSQESAYARVCGLTLLKAKNLAFGSYSLILDGLGQETGALMRPMIEYLELLIYFRMFPESVEKATTNTLPSAGKRAEAINGIYKEFREHLNTHASHSSFSDYSLLHLLESDLSSFKFKKQQIMAPRVLDTNVRDLAVQLHMLLLHAARALEPTNATQFIAIAAGVDKLKARMFDVFDLNSDTL